MKPVEPSLQLPRLSESGDPALSAALAHLRDRKPDAAELASLASRLALQGIAVTAPAASAGAAARAAWKKWALLGGGAASGLAVWFSLATPHAAVSVAPAPAPGLNVGATSSRTRDSHEVTATSRKMPAARPRETSSATAATVSENAPSPPSGDEPEPELARELEPRLIASPHSERAEPPPPSGTSARTKALATSTPASAPLPAAVDSGAPTEIELLRDARLALKQSPGRALELTESHARAFPGGKLSQERELIAISALVALGRRTAALSRAHRFNEAFPQSAYRNRIADLLR